MSNQESMFHPPEQTQQRPVLNNDPREQPAPGQQQWHQPLSASYEEGYSGAESYMSQLGGEKLRPRQSLENWQWVLIVAGAFFLGLLMGGFFNAFFGFLFGVLGLGIAIFFVLRFGFNRATALPTRSFTISQRAKLIIRNSTGSIYIRRGTSSTVEVRAVKHVNTLFNQNIEGGLEYSQEGDTITVTGQSLNSGFFTSGITHINLEIIVPESSDLEFEGNAGTISMVGINGQACLKTSAGTIDIAQSSLEGTSNITTNAGTISVRQTRLKGTANFETNAGTIHFDGSLDPQGSYQFTTNAGTIDAVLPASSSFILDAATDLGTVSNAFGSNVVGSAPQAQLRLRTNLGTVSVRKR